METGRPRGGKEPFLSVLRALVETHAAVMRADSRHIRKLGLTPSQFDVLATLGNTPGMSAGELSARTLVTKGTLTGVVDRLLARGLVERRPRPGDRRGVMVKLTPRGETFFHEVFPRQIGFLKPVFQRALSRKEMQQLRGLLMKLKESFEEMPT